MAYTEILTGCTHSIGGLKDFNISTRDTDGNPLSFPLDVVFKSGSTNTILVSDDFENRIMTLGNMELQYRHVMPDFVTHVEEEIKERQGNYYRKTLEFSLPKVNLTTQNQLKEFLFTSGGEFAVSNAVVWFTDTNGHKWISGWNIPFVLENFDLTTGGEDNNYKLTYICNDYYRTFKYENE